jgi:hypothetical protein
VYPCILTSRSHCLTEVRVAHKLERDVEHDEYHTHEDRRIAFQTYVTSGLGLDLTAKAWPSLTQVFSAGYLGIWTAVLDDRLAPCVERNLFVRSPHCCFVAIV